MFKKWGLLALTTFLIYSIAIYFYIFHMNDIQIPEPLKGSVADPETFMTEKELLLSNEYGKIRNFLFFIITPLEWLVYFFILISGLSRMLEKWSDLNIKWKFVHSSIYIFYLTSLVTIFFFPLDYFRYTLSKKYGISTQTFSSWMKDFTIDYWINLATMIIVISVLYWLFRKSPKRWWFHAWLLTIPFSIFLMYIQPVIIDPLYNDFYPLKDKQLEKEILALANKANIPSEHVYEVNMADKTNALNAYVTGIGNNSRIVLWDTTLNTLSKEEILFVMAHEMGHYVQKHIYFGIAGNLLLIFFGLWLLSKIIPWIIVKFGRGLKVKSMNNIHSLPLILLITSMLLFLSNPLTNFISRYQETRADLYAIDLVEDKYASVTAFQQLTKAGLSEVNPPSLVKWFRYTHPPMLERINRVAEYGEKENETSVKSK